MAQPYVGEIRMFAGNFAPAGWRICDGSLIPISQNDALFTLLGTTYGGDGQETFGLPNLGGRIPVHQGRGADGVTYLIGQSFGVEDVTLTTNQIPAHNHALIGSTAPATGTNPNSLVFGTGAVTAYMIEADVEVALNPNAVALLGGSQPHSNQQPFLTINYIISLFGIFPSQS